MVFVTNSYFPFTETKRDSLIFWKYRKTEWLKHIKIEKLEERKKERRQKTERQKGLQFGLSSDLNEL